MRITEKQLKESIKKDFNNLYQKQFTADYIAQRMIRSIEINVMSFENTMKLILRK
jgi:hypothetical protein